MAYNNTKDEFINNYWGLARRTIDRYGDKEFVVTPIAAITYREANQRANVICAALRGIVKDKNGLGVGLFMNEACSIVSAMMGVLKSRNYFVPLDVNNPESLLRYIFEAAEMKVILTTGSYFERVRALAGGNIAVVSLDELDFERKVTDPVVAYSPDDIVQVLFTSGSTGQPKGAIEDYHYLGRGVFLKTASRVYEPDDRTLHLSTFNYSALHISLFTALTIGHTFCYYDVKEDGIADLPGWLHGQRISDFHCTPTLLRSLVSVLAPDETFPNIDTFHLGAEKKLDSDVQSIKKHFPNVQKVRFGFSSTETQNVCSTIYPIDYDFGHKELPSGYPQKDIKVFIWDEQGKALPVGQEGEIVVCGDALVRGYINNPELTQKRFIPDPNHPGWRYFKTGDLGKFRPDGQLVHLGRMDNMVKIRGIRIELESIEAHMLSYPGIVQVTSRAFEDKNGNKRLASYFVAEKGVQIPISDLRKYLAERLPLSQLPHYLIALDEIPIIASGKVAVDNLPAPKMVRPSLSNEYVSPADALENQLAAVWEEQIGVSGIGVTDDFFEVGGDSLIGALVLASIEEKTERNLPVSTLLTAPTIRKQAELIRNEDGKQKFLPIIPINANGDQIPLFFIPGKGGFPTRIRHLAKKINPRTPVYALQDLVVDQPRRNLRSIESIASFYIGEIKKLYPRGPYILVGESLGGKIAYEIAQQLLKSGEKAPVLVMLDTYNTEESIIDGYREKKNLPFYEMLIKKHLNILLKSDWQGKLEYLKFYRENGGQKLDQFLKHARDGMGKENPVALPKNMLKYESANRKINNVYQVRPYPERVILFKAMRGPASSNPTNGWGQISLGKLFIHPLDCYHGSILFEPAVSQVATILQDYLEKVPD